MISGKAWGETQEIIRRGGFEVHRIVVKAGGHSSIHRHRHKYNGFFVESGRLVIRTWKNDYDLIDSTVLGPGQFTTVAPTERHQFEAMDETVAYEIYWVELDGDDIVRENRGGIG